MACIFQWWASSNCPRSSWASQLDAHLHSFILSFHTLIALVHPSHGNPYSLHWHQLMGISIARWLAASMWDFLLICLLTQPPSSYSIPPIVLCPWLAIIYCMKVYRFEITKVWNNCLACHRGCAWWEHVVWRKWSMAKLCDFVGISFLWLCYFDKT